ncbi:MAG: S8 family serine peptidase, partial [Candidatus Competibacteraceae bacterium]|nr:S8 family serine peptidase [Candidatus Competibacteraceae bacterium]
MRLHKPLTTAITLALLGGLGPPAQAGGAEVDQPTALKLRYTGAPCPTAVEYRCIDHAPGGTAQARILARSDGQYWFDGLVEQGKEFVPDAMNGDQITFGSSSMILELFDDNGRLLQTVELPLDGSLTKGFYGGLELKDVSYKFEPPKSYALNDRRIVMFAENTPWEAIEAYAKYWKDYGVHLAMELPMLNALVLRVPAYVPLEDLAADSRVLWVENDQGLGVGELLDGQGRSFIRPQQQDKLEKEVYPWGVVRMLGQSVGYTPTDAPIAPLDKDALPYSVQLALEKLSEAKIRVAVFDTGLNGEFGLANNIRGGLDIINPEIKDNGQVKYSENGQVKYSEKVPMDDNGHGSHVAGIIASVLDKDLKLGKGAKVELYGVKVLDRYATGPLSNILLGLQWAIDNDIDVVNMSLGYSSDSPAIR